MGKQRHREVKRLARCLMIKPHRNASLQNQVLEPMAFIDLTYSTQRTEISMAGSVYNVAEAWVVMPIHWEESVHWWVSPAEVFPAVMGSLKLFGCILLPAYSRPSIKCFFNKGVNESLHLIEKRIWSEALANKRILFAMLPSCMLRVDGSLY